MRKNILAISASAILLNMGMVSEVHAAGVEDDVHSRCIVQLKDTVDSTKVKGIAHAFSDLSNASIKHVYTHSIKGFTINMPCFAARTAFGDSEFIKSMEPDSIVTAFVKPPSPPGLDKPDDPEPESEQEVSYGTTRVGGSVDGTGKTAWVIDTGIDLDHPDLNVDASKGFTVFRTMDDENGHGTHVAGIIGAKDNNIDSAGVASNATIVPVRVLNRKGSGYVSGVIAGIDYVAANAALNDCVNLSLGGGISESLDAAVINAAANTGAFFTLAAGNESDDANNYSPARANGVNVYTISAIDEYDSMAYFSNYGNPPIDYAAPGVKIFSLWLRGRTNTISGTSMAAPHACAVLMMSNGHPATSGETINDPDDTADSIIHLP